jgi:hypothetical protein
VYRSQVFPVLCLDAEAVIAGDMTRVLDAPNEGLASDTCRGFVRGINFLDSYTGWLVRQVESIA